MKRANPIGKISFSGIAYVAAMAMILAVVTGWNPLMILPGLVALSFIPMPHGALMAVTREIWTKDIVENLYKDNQWALRAFNADMYVLLGKVVHIPVAGNPATITKNLTVFPAVGVKRTDTDITYSIDTFYSEPRHIEKIEQYELEYDKRQSALGEDQAAIIEAAMDSLLFRWAPGVAKTIATIGADADATVSGATGMRKALTKKAFSQIKLAMSKANVPKKGRVAILTEDHYDQFFESLSEAEKTDVGRVANLETGVVGRYLGFDIYTRSTVLRYRGAAIGATAVVVDEQDAGFAASDKTADRAASLFYQDTCNERAKGEVEMFDDAGNPAYYGDIFSFILRLGGRIRRTTGVWAVVEELV